MFERFTTPAQKSVLMAQEEARVHHTSPVGVDHLLLGIVRMHEDDAVSRALSVVTCTIPELYERLDAEVPTGPARPDGKIPFAPATKDVMVQALKEAQARKDAHIGNEHLLLAISANGGSMASTVLAAEGGTHDAMAAGLGRAAGTEPGFQVRTTKGFGRFRKGGNDRGTAT